MSVQPEFDTISEADAAFFGSTDGDTSGGDPTSTGDPTGPTGPGGTRDGSQNGSEQAWGELQVEPTDWVAGWTLGYQPHLNESRRRWFVFRVNPETEQFEALNMQGQADSYSQDTSLEELPHTNREQEAREAYQAWVEENGSRRQGEDGEDGQGGQGGEGSPGGSGSESDDVQWGEWQRLNQVAGWTIWGREAQNSDRTQFLAAGQTAEEEAIYLQSDGTAGSEPEIYDSQEALQEALDAWQSRVENGEVPEGGGPNGISPSRERVSQDAREAGADRARGELPGTLAGAVEAVGGRRNAMILGTIGLIGALYLAESQGYVDLGLQDMVNDLTGAVQHG